MKQHAKELPLDGGNLLVGVPHLVVEMQGQSLQLPVSGILLGIQHADLVIMEMKDMALTISKADVSSSLPDNNNSKSNNSNKSMNNSRL
jgi:hypothetical protein